jgi:Ca2+-binding RTX toxin-like protein
VSLGNYNNFTVSQTGRVFQGDDSDFGAFGQFTGASIGNSIINFGHITADNGVSFYSSAGINTFENYGTINTTGTQLSLNSVALFWFSDGVFINGGTAISAKYGVFFDASSGLNTVDNSGMLSGEFGVYFESGTGCLDLTNSGVLTGGNGVVIDDNGAGSTYFNSGSINGVIDVADSTGVTDLTNFSVIYGDVLLGNMADAYRGRDDGFISGELFAGEGDDSLFGGASVDKFYGEAGEDKMWGREGHDKLYGGEDNDDIRGNEGDDYIQGNQGNDRIKGGRGDDMMSGKSGADIFIFGRNNGEDTIDDFANDTGKLDMSAFGLSSKQDLLDAGAIVELTMGTMIDLTALGGDGVIYVEDMALGQWGNSDFIF